MVTFQTWPREAPARDLALLQAVRDSIVAGQGVVSQNHCNQECVSVVLYRGPEDSEFVQTGKCVALWNSPLLPPNGWLDTLSCFDLLIAPSEPVAYALRRLLPAVRVVSCFVPFQVVESPHVDWLDWKSCDYRVYTVALEHEVGTLYPLFKAFLQEYRDTDSVSLTAVYHGRREEAERALEFAISECELPQTRRPRIQLLCGPWSLKQQLSLAEWGDCLILPWASSCPAVEVLYAAQFGNFIAVPNWCSDLSPSSCLQLDFSLNDDGFVEVDWGQVAAVMRIAVANGRRQRMPPKMESRKYLSSAGHFFRLLMGNL